MRWPFLRGDRTAVVASAPACDCHSGPTRDLLRYGELDSQSLSPAMVSGVRGRRATAAYEIAVSAAVAGTRNYSVASQSDDLTARSNQPCAGSISGPYFGYRSQPCCTTVFCGRWNGPKIANRSLRLRIDGPNRAKQK
jgi:hypothetical protein